MMLHMRIDSWSSPLALVTLIVHGRLWGCMVAAMKHASSSVHTNSVVMSVVMPDRAQGSQRVCDVLQRSLCQQLQHWLCLLALRTSTRIALRFDAMGPHRHLPTLHSALQRPAAQTRRKNSATLRRGLWT